MIVNEYLYTVCEVPLSETFLKPSKLMADLDLAECCQRVDTEAEAFPP